MIYIKRIKLPVTVNWQFESSGLSPFQPFPVHLQVIRPTLGGVQLMDATSPTVVYGQFLPSK